MTQKSDKSAYARNDIELPQFKGHKGEWGMANDPPPNGARSAPDVRGPEHTNATPCATAQQLAERIRRVAARVRDREPVSAQDLGQVANIPDPNGGRS